MHRHIFEGSGTAITTPMKPDGTIDYESYEKLLEFQIKNGTKAIITAGTTGEASVLSDDERRKLIEFTVAVVNRRIPVIAGAGANSTEHAVRLSKLAYSAGADALLHVTPYYNKCTPDGLVAHYTKCAYSADIPIILYNVPSRTGVDINMSVYDRLAGISNITAIKEASGSVVKTEQLLSHFGDRYTIYSGCDNINFPLLCLGAKGIISVASNIIPDKMEQLCEYVFNNDVKSGAQLQLEFFELTEALFIETSPAPVKCALNLMGFGSNVLRLPLTPVSQQNEEKLAGVLRKHGLIN